jgi:hypothetical protein
MTVQFPSNPNHGDIFEPIPGLYYQYDNKTNAWIQLDGVEGLGLATPLANGLMSKEDFKKLQNLIVPPPQASLTGEDCNVTFRQGQVALESLDGSVTITSTPTVMNKAANYPATALPWQLHTNTVGIDFRLNLEQLLDEMEKRGNLSKVQIQGDPGLKGATGKAGADRLNTGPVGVKGLPGANSPFEGNLTTEDIPFERLEDSQNRAIVDVTTEEVSEDENYLVLTRGNIGNPDACPSEVVPKTFNSPLVFVLNTLSGGKRIRNRKVTTRTDDCALVCRICASTIHHLNLEIILDQIYEQFKKRVANLKASKEALARIWLQGMVELFNESKSALCCALENCKSRQRNQETRQYIESQRIQAAQADFSLTIDKGVEDRQFTDMNAGRDCPVPETDSGEGSVIFTNSGAIFRLDSKIHISDPRTGQPLSAVSGFLPAGTYTVEITNCCANLNTSTGAWSGRAAFLYRVRTAIASTDETREIIEDKILSFPDLGVSSNNSGAQNNYRGLTLSFEHAGGNISAWIVDADGLTSNNSGTIELTFVNAASLSSETAPTSGYSYVYREELRSDRFIGRVAHFSGSQTGEAHYNLSGESGNPSDGPSTLNEVLLNTYFYNATDGLHLVILGGTPTPGTDSTFSTNAEIRVQIDNNTLRNEVKVADGIVRQLSANEFEVFLNIDQDTEGAVIGPLDPTADWAVTIDPVNLGLLQEWSAPSADGNDLTLARSGEEGLGAQTDEISNVNAVVLYDVCDVPDPYGSECGMQIQNYLNGQNVYITRPVNIDIDSGAPVEVPVISGPPPDGSTTTEVPPASTNGCVLTAAETAEAIVAGTIQPDPTSIQDVVVTFLSASVQAMRYIFTDSDGDKHYSAFIPTTEKSPGNWMFISLGKPIKVVTPPDFLTTEIIQSKNLDMSLLQDKLTSSQLKAAESLQGISRLTYVQGLLGTSIDKASDLSEMVDFEIEFQNMSSSGAEFGDITVRAGNTDYIIDDFEPTPVVDVEAPAATLLIPGEEKREIARGTGNNLEVGGLLCTSLASYYSTVGGFDTGNKNFLFINGNMFFTLNTEGQDRFLQISAERGFQYIGLGQHKAITRSTSGQVTTGGILVDDLGGFYYADGPEGRIDVIRSVNAFINNPPSGDVSDLGQNHVFPMATDLKKTSKAPLIAFDAPMKDANGQILQVRLIAHFEDQWYRINSNIGWVRFEKNGYRPVNHNTGSLEPMQTLGTGPAGNSLAIDRGPDSNNDDDFNHYYTLDGNKIYEVFPTTGVRTEVVSLPVNGFDLHIHPITKEFYYVVDDGGTTPRSGTRINRYIPTAAAGSEHFTYWIFGITFGHPLPDQDDLRVVYALVSNLTNTGTTAVTTRLVEVADQSFPGAPTTPAAKINTIWSGSGTGGLLTNQSGVPNAQGNPNRIIFSRIPPGAGCQMHYKQVQWYERGWRINACCGALVSVGGIQYIVVKRSLGVDTSCGGGESITTPCIAQYIDTDGHPAIAWPTVDGEEFLGLPTSGFVNFVKDDSLSTSILSAINSGQATRTKGNPGANIPFILFPAT